MEKYKNIYLHVDTPFYIELRVHVCLCVCVCVGGGCVGVGVGVFVFFELLTYLLLKKGDLFWLISA